MNKPKTNSIRRKLNIRGLKFLTLPIRFIIGFLDHYLIKVDLDKTSLFEEHPTYLLMRNLIFSYPSINQSEIFLNLSRKLNCLGKANFKKYVFDSHLEIQNFINYYYHDVVISIKINGFVYKKTREVGSCGIGPNGELIKSLYGRHRFSIAKIFGVSKFPLIVDFIDYNFYMSRKLDNLSYRVNIIRILRDIESEYSQ